MIVQTFGNVGYDARAVVLLNKQGGEIAGEADVCTVDLLELDIAAADGDTQDRGGDPFLVGDDHFNGIGVIPLVFSIGDEFILDPGFLSQNGRNPGLR